MVWKISVGYGMTEWPYFITEYNDDAHIKLEMWAVLSGEEMKIVDNERKEVPMDK
jgi:hypothetical protein